MNKNQLYIGGNNSYDDNEACTEYEKSLEAAAAALLELVRY
jgi:hypothetical protein